jgi:hypothetical protein
MSKPKPIEIIIKSLKKAGLLRYLEFIWEASLYAIRGDCIEQIFKLREQPRYN